MGLITQADLPDLIKLDRLCPLLVRIGGGRFTCAAQDLEHLIACVIAGGDYVRDVSFPVGSIERAGKWQPEPQTFMRLPAHEQNEIAHDEKLSKMHDALWPNQKPQVYFDEHDEGGASDGNQVHVQFNESDCGGVFDGNRVISDADSGL